MATNPELKDLWETPDDLFQKYNAIYAFVLDAAANRDNHKCDNYFGPGGIHEDALVADWTPYLKRGNIWLNPPYSRGLQRKFIEKALDEYTKYDQAHSHMLNDFVSPHHVVCLLPADTGTKLFHEIIKPYNSSIEFLRGRVRFKGAAAGARFSSMVVIF